MHSLQTRIVAVTLSLLLGLASCYDNDPNYPPEPEISFLNVGEVSFDGVDNDVTIYLTLQDGDGDVGTPEGESPSCRADGNFCDYTTDSACINDPFYDVVLIDQRDSCYVLLNLPNLTPSGDIKAISGEVDLFVNGLTCKPLFGQAQDTVVFDVYIKDRSGNLSNVVTTAPIVLGCPQ